MKKSKPSGRRTKDTCKQLFELVQTIGETLSGDLHIIKTSATDDEGEEYRVYIKSPGYCFDVSKNIETEDEEGTPLLYYYDFFAEWPGFAKLDEVKAYDILK